MLEVAAEDLHASPCIICGQPGAFVGVWAPTAECIARDLSGDPTKFRRLVYRLCEPCVSERGVTSSSSLLWKTRSSNSGDRSRPSIQRRGKCASCNATNGYALRSDNNAKPLMPSSLRSIV